MSRDHQQNADAISPETRGIAGMIRRLVVVLTRTALWQVTGHRLLDNTIETHDAPVFGGIGFASRPPASGNPEAIVVFPGGPSNPLIAALRDEKTRAAVFKVAGEMQADESATFNSLSLVRIKPDGTIEIRSLAGVAAPLGTKADLAALKTAIAGAAVVAGDGGAAFKANLLAALAAWPVGTTKLKAE